MAADYHTNLQRFLGYRVVITTYGYVKIWGNVAAVNDDHLRLVDTVVTSEHDDQGWLSQMQNSEPDGNYGLRNAETIVQFHQIVAISCQDDLPESRRSIRDAELSADQDEPLILAASTRSSLANELDSVVLAAENDSSAEQRESPWEKALLLDRCRLELGRGLLPLVSGEKSGLLRRLPLLREEVAGDLGLVAPLVRIRDNPRLDPNAYRIFLDGSEVARGEIHADRWLAINTGHTTKPLAGIPTKEPLYGMSGVWITAAQREQAELFGYLICEPAGALVVHLQNIFEQRAADIFSIDDLKRLLETLEKTAPVVVAEATARVPLPQLFAVLRRLLQEDISIRNLARILEGVALRACTPFDILDLVAAARKTIRHSLCEQLLAEDGRLYVVVLEPQLADRLARTLGEGGVARGRWATNLAESLAKIHDGAAPKGQECALLVDAALRAPLWQALRVALPDQCILAVDEIPAEIDLEIVESVRLLDIFSPAEAAYHSATVHEAATSAARRAGAEFVEAPPGEPAPPRRPR